VSPQAKKEYLKRMWERYQQVKPSQRGALLDEMEAMTGFHRKALIRRMHRPERPPRRGTRRGRPRQYGRAVIAALVVIWTAAGYPWSKRLKALLPTWLPYARRHMALSAATEARLQQMSARQMDRCLAGQKRVIRRRLYGRTKPGSLLKHHIPLKTDRWDVHEPGFTEVDLVSHSGDCAEGEFAHSLNVTDILTAWVGTRAVLGKSQVRVQGALAQLRADLPFPLKGIDSDNGSEFINAHLKRYCDDTAIQFTRGRPYKKDDNAHIEQKNWTHVRKLIGYDRYDTAAGVEAMNDLYADAGRLQNLFLPSVKLVEKVRVGARTRRRYDAPQTPLDRLVASGQGDAAKVRGLLRQRAHLDPFALAQRVERHLERIYRLANRRTRPATTVRTADRPTAGPPVEAARPVEAKNASTRSLEKPRSGFSTATTGHHHRVGAKEPEPARRRKRVTRIMARRSPLR
jgi:hypothetical protein